MERHHDHNSYVVKRFIGAVYCFRGSVHYHQGRKHGSVQADMVREKKLRGLHLVLKAARRRLKSGFTLGRAERGIPQSPPMVTHFLQQDHIS